MIAFDNWMGIFFGDLIDVSSISFRYFWKHRRYVIANRLLIHLNFIFQLQSLTRWTEWNGSWSFFFQVIQTIFKVFFFSYDTWITLMGSSNGKSWIFNSEFELTLHWGVRKNSFRWTDPVSSGSHWSRIVSSLFKVLFHFLQSCKRSIRDPFFSITPVIALHYLVILLRCRVRSFTRLSSLDCSIFLYRVLIDTNRNWKQFDINGETSILAMLDNKIDNSNPYNRHTSAS